MATSKTRTWTLDPGDPDPDPDTEPWARTLDPGPGPWTRTLKTWNKYRIKKYV